MRQQLPLIRCVQCHREFAPIRVDGKYCSRTCLERHFIDERRLALQMYRQMQRQKNFGGDFNEDTGINTERKSLKMSEWSREKEIAARQRVMEQYIAELSEWLANPHRYDGMDKEEVLELLTKILADARIIHDRIYREAFKVAQEAQEQGIHTCGYFDHVTEQYEQGERQAANDFLDSFVAAPTKPNGSTKPFLRRF